MVLVILHELNTNNSIPINPRIFDFKRSMLTKVTIKLIQSLKDKKNRQLHGLFLVEGTKAVMELLASKIVVKTLFATGEWISLHKVLLKDNCELEIVNEKELKQLSNQVSPQPVIALAFIPNYDITKIDFSKGFSIALDEIQDPGNLGTIIRIADWYGIKNIICSKNCADVYNPKVIQSTMGSFLRVNVFYENLSAFFSAHNKIPVYGALMNGKNLHQTKINSDGILLIGNEGSGISDELLTFVTHPITIPKIGDAESLNASIATAIICDAWARGKIKN